MDLDKSVKFGMEMGCFEKLDARTEDIGICLLSANLVQEYESLLEFKLCPRNLVARTWVYVLYLQICCMEYGCLIEFKLVYACKMSH